MYPVKLIYFAIINVQKFWKKRLINAKKTLDISLG